MPDSALTSKPSRDDAPDDCQFADCERTPTRWVRYTRPKEYLCFCDEHAERSKEMADHATRSALIT